MFGEYIKKCIFAYNKQSLDVENTLNYYELAQEENIIRAFRIFYGMDMDGVVRYSVQYVSDEGSMVCDYSLN